jgi:hypothetical protein
MSGGTPQQQRGPLPTDEEETTMEIPYGPRGLHAELEARFDRLLADRRRTRRTLRADRRQAR